MNTLVTATTFFHFLLTENVAVKNPDGDLIFSTVNY